MDDNNNNDDSDDDTTADAPITDVVFRRGDEYNDHPDHVDYDAEEYEWVRLIIHESVVVINEGAFYKCKSIMEVVFHNNITRIEDGAFSDCYRLRRIINGLPEGLIHLGEYAFSHCHSLQGRMTIPQNVQQIRSHCFSYCDSLESVVFYREANVQFGDCIFMRCENLRSVTLPQNLRSIPSCFFAGCPLLEKIELPMLIQEIGYWAFHSSGLRAIDLSDNVRSIEEEAFSQCQSLTTVTIRSSSVSNLLIGRDVFRACSSLSTIKVYPWIWPQILESMKDDPTFVFKFFNLYHKHIFDFKNLITDQRQRRVRRRIDDD